jgi:seryl-tRNA synthetase
MTLPNLGKTIRQQLKEAQDDAVAFAKRATEANSQLSQARAELARIQEWHNRVCAKCPNWAEPKPEP